MCCGPFEGCTFGSNTNDFAFLEFGALVMELVSSDVTAAQEVGEHDEEFVEELRVFGTGDDGSGGAGWEADASAEIVELGPERVVWLAGVWCGVLWPRLVVHSIVRTHGRDPAQVVGKHVRQ